MISSITIFGGNNKFGEKEKIHKIEIREGEIIGIVGPTGSGKSALIEDIEQLAQTDTGTGRRVLINNAIPNENIRSNPKLKLVAQLSQNMNFLADMSVINFLELHCKCRGKDKSLASEVIQHANTLTGEPIKKEHNFNRSQWRAKQGFNGCRCCFYKQFPDCFDR